MGVGGMLFDVVAKAQTRFPKTGNLYQIVFDANRAC